LQDFFSNLPRQIEAGLLTKACIPTEDGGLAAPIDRPLLCRSEAVRALVSGPVAQRVLGLRFVSGQCSALMESEGLRRMLGVEEFSADRVVQQLKKACEVGAAHVQWCSRCLGAGVALTRCTCRVHYEYPELSLSREGDMLSAGAHTQAIIIYKVCNMSRAQTPLVPVFPWASALGRDPQS
jgi:hypothetical protein